MKNIYVWLMLGVIAGTLVLIACSYSGLLGCDSQAERLIEILGTCAVAITVIVALSATNPAVKKIKASVEAYIAPQDSGEKIYNKADLSGELKDFYNRCPDPFKSYRIQFKITNTSGFDWVKPTVTFWLPAEKQAPGKDREDNRTYTVRQYRSNTFNTKVDLKMLEMVDGVIISNSNLPYWKQEKHIAIWLRMVLENGDSEPFKVEVSVDCEGAEGYTETVQLNPKELPKNMGATESSPAGGDTG